MAESNKKYNKCGRCGRKEHDCSDDCPAIGKQCNKCNKYNHFASACRSSRNVNIKKTTVNITHVNNSGPRYLVNHQHNSRYDSVSKEKEIQKQRDKSNEKSALAGVIIGALGND